jgi:hypothetical protein
MKLERTTLPDGNRDPLTVMEIVVKALGARYPVVVARTIPPDCRDVPAAVAALRERRPHWFHSADGSPVAGVPA